jgi:RNA polymerase sigma-B factor
VTSPHYQDRTGQQDRTERSCDGPYDHLAPVFEELTGLDENDPRRAELRDLLVTEHLPLARNIARRFSGRGEPHEDLVQVAMVGLINSVDRFDPARGTDFLSFAVPTIMGEVRRHFRDASWALRVPRRLKEMRQSISAAVGLLSQRLGRAPTPSEIASHLGLPKEEVYEGLQASNAYRSASLDELLLDDDNTVSLGDTIGEDDARIEGVDDRESLAPLLQELPERERRILVLRFFRNMTQTQIADRLGISQMHVSRLLGRTLATLREGLIKEQ